MMTETEALRIVLDLALQNMIERDSLDFAEGEAEAEFARQDEATDIVSAMIEAR